MFSDNVIMYMSQQRSRSSRIADSPRRDRDRSFSQERSRSQSVLVQSPILLVQIAIGISPRRNSDPISNDAKMQEIAIIFLINNDFIQYQCKPSNSLPTTLKPTCVSSTMLTSPKTTTLESLLQLYSRYTIVYSITIIHGKFHVSMFSDN